MLKPAKSEHNPAQRWPRRRSPAGNVVLALKAACLGFAVVLVTSIVVKTFLASFFLIPSGSMEQTLRVGDRVMVSKLTPGLFDLRRGDVVVFSDPGGWLIQDTAAPYDTADTADTADARGTDQSAQEPAGDLVKRVIGLPGDHVMCCTA